MSEFVNLMGGCIALVALSIAASIAIGVMVAATSVAITGVVAYRVVTGFGKMLTSGFSRT